MLSRKSLIQPPDTRSPTQPLPLLGPGDSPVLGHIKFASPMGLSFQWWPTRPSFDTYAARDKSSGVLFSSYCCSTYRVAVPFSSLGTFSSSSIGGHVTHPIADCDHPLGMFWVPAGFCGWDLHWFEGSKRIQGSNVKTDHLMILKWTRFTARTN